METPDNPPSEIIAADFPDYFKSELMETLIEAITWSALLLPFPDYFKSELMETKMS